MTEPELNEQFSNIECPKCKAEIEVDLAQIIHHETIECPKCKLKINLEEFDNEAEKTKSRNQKELNKLEDLLKKLKEE